MRKFIAVVGAVAATATLSAGVAQADTSGVTATFTNTKPGQTTANIRFSGEHRVAVVKQNPRTGNERVVRMFTAPGEHSKTVHFPRAKRWQRVVVKVDGVEVGARMVEMPRGQWPVVKPRPWASINTWSNNAVVWVHGRQPRNTRATKRGAFYRVQVVRAGHVRTVQRGRVGPGDGDRSRLRVRGYRGGPKFVTVRVKSRGHMIGQKRLRVRF